MVRVKPMDERIGVGVIIKQDLENRGPGTTNGPGRGGTDGADRQGSYTHSPGGFHAGRKKLFSGGKEDPGSLRGDEDLLDDARDAGRVAVQKERNVKRGGNLPGSSGRRRDGDRRIGSIAGSPLVKVSC